MTNGVFDAWGMIDALKSLGALDDDQEEHVATVMAEMNEVLADRNNPDFMEACGRPMERAIRSSL